jgi:hypothetical protein
MRRWLGELGLWVLLLAVITPESAWAGSEPLIRGRLAGRDSCPAEVCSAAVLKAEFSGQPDGGSFFAELLHDGLPARAQCTELRGGRWQLTTKHDVVRGHVEGGTLCNTAAAVHDRYETFTIRATLRTRGHEARTLHLAGALDFSLLLREPPRRPTFRGELVQDPR